MVHWQRLLREPPSDLVSRVIDKGPGPVALETPLASVTRYFAATTWWRVPIVDAENHLPGGAVTVDDLLDHLLGDNWREATGTDDD